jgi:glycerophosphoryl diester phosphodiesterase
MSQPNQRTIRIAHAYGNRRDKLDEALAADVDLIEVDLWYRAGDFWCRHERRARFLPLLYDRRPRGGLRDDGPWALTVFPRHYVRPDLHPLRLSELLARTNGKRRLLLDLKDEDVAEDDARVIAEALVRALAEAGCEDAQVCGQTDVLDEVRQAGPHLDVRYSVERQEQWDALLRRLDAGVTTRGLCLYHRFFDDGVARFTADNGLEVYAWTIDDPARAREVVEMGASGITSNSLPLLEAL